MAAPSSHATESPTLTPGTEEQIGSDISTAGYYSLHVDFNALVDHDEEVWVVVKDKVQSGGTTRELDRYCAGRGTTGTAGAGVKNHESRWYAVLNLLQFFILQRNGTGRTIPCEIKKQT